MFKPYLRPRRLRSRPNIRRLIRETLLAIDDLILPLFVVEGKDIAYPVNSMPGVYQLSIDLLVKEILDAQKLKIPAIMLFGVPTIKDSSGSGAMRKDGLIPNAVKMIKDAVPDMYVITDICFCGYMDHGHCGTITDGIVDNDATLEIIGCQAVLHCEAGADMVAPSGMMDGMVGAMREALDQNNFESTPIMSYAAKYASAFYGPFREAAASAPQYGDRRSYQMDPANRIEALKEVALDIEEGADIVMVKPALAFMDVIQSVRKTTQLPVAAYNVSGEYAMVKAASQLDWINEQEIVFEILTSIKRAGANMILTYFATDVAKWLADS
jgi:porphobilinogen synthase